MAVVTHSELADYIETAARRFFEEYKENAGVCGAGMRMLSEVLKVMGVKTSEEGVRAGLTRLREGVTTTSGLDIMNPSHRQELGQMLRQMFEPLGVGRIMILGLSEMEDGGIDPHVFIVQLCQQGKPHIENIRGLFEFLSRKGVDGEDLAL